MCSRALAFRGWVLLKVTPNSVARGWPSPATCCCLFACTLCTRVSSSAKWHTDHSSNKAVRRSSGAHTLRTAAGRDQALNKPQLFLVVSYHCLTLLIWKLRPGAIFANSRHWIKAWLVSCGRNLVTSARYVHSPSTWPLFSCLWNGDFDAIRQRAYVRMAAALTTASRDGTRDKKISQFCL